MNTMFAIRKNVFGASQKEMAAIAQTTQSTVSRWESGELLPDLAQLDRIRSVASQRGLKWSDGWLFEPAPKPDSAAA